MAKKLALVLCIFLIGTFVTGCGESLMFWKKKKEIEVVHKKLPPFKTLFERTVEMYNSKQYKSAIDSFLFLRENYPQETAYQSRITLYLADSHYHQKEYPEAIANYREFIKLYPTSPDVPYAYFQIGMCNYKQRRSYDRDATFVRKAIKSFKKVLDIAPPGVLVNESIRMIALCQHELALHDLFIANFYYRTHHYKSAIFRYEDILRTFPDFKIYDQAHLGIGKSYLKLKKRNEAYRHLSYVARNFPDTRYGKEAWKLLQKDFKISSADQLPIVTFQIAPTVPLKLSKGTSASTLKKEGNPYPEKASKKPLRKQVKASVKPVPLSEKISVAAIKPHTYFPKITKIQQKPSIYAPPVKKTIEARLAKKSPLPPTPSKATKVKRHKNAPKPRATSTHIAPPQMAQRASEPPPLKSTPPAPARTTAKMKSASNPPAPIQIQKNGGHKKKRPAFHKPEKRPTHIGKMVKTDTLPPEKVPKPSSGLIGALDTRKPIHITSDHVSAKQGKNAVRFYGRVVVKQQNITLTCDNLTAFYAAGGKAIDKIIAHGNVVITQLNKKVKCGKAIFYNAERKIELEGSPIAWDGSNRISGNKMVLLLDKNEIQILGSSKKPTELVIYPNAKPDLLKRPGKAK